jgi:hypothetical protein
MSSRSRSRSAWMPDVIDTLKQTVALRKKEVYEAARSGSGGGRNLAEIDMPWCQA